MELRDELTPSLLPEGQDLEEATGGGLASSCQLALPQQKASPRKALGQPALISPIPR